MNPELALVRDLYEEIKSLRAENSKLFETIVQLRESRATKHLDLLMVDRLRYWAEQIRRKVGDSRITEWGDPDYVARHCDLIAEGIEAAVKNAPH